MEEKPLDISSMSLKAIQRLTDAELAPIIRQGHLSLGLREPTEEVMKSEIEAVRWGHWAPGLPSFANKVDVGPESIGL